MKIEPERPIRDAVTALIDLKSIITIVLVAALVWGFVAKIISTDQFIPFAMMVLTFYFAKKSNNDNEGKG